ncbi:MAG: hypothetical protein ACRCXT_02285 [Paraclostridium sp.]
MINNMNGLMGNNMMGVGYQQQPQQDLYGTGANYGYNPAPQQQIQQPQGGSNMNNKQQNQEQEDLVLQVEQQEFDGLFKTKITTVTELGKLINRMVKPAIIDCEGCLVIPNQMGDFDTILYFKPSPSVDYNNIQEDGPIVGLQPVYNTAKQLTPGQRLTALTARQKNKTFNISEDAKSILNEFMSNRVRNKKGVVDWNKCVSEKTNSYYGSYSIYVQISGLDVKAFLKKYYGNTLFDIDEDGKVTNKRPCEYSISILRGLGMPMQGNMYNDYLISIMQLDGREMENVARKAGMVPLTNDIPMIKEF